MLNFKVQPILQTGQYPGIMLGVSECFQEMVDGIWSRVSWFRPSYNRSNYKSKTRWPRKFTVKLTDKLGGQGGTNIDERCLGQDRMGELGSNDSNSNMRSQDEARLTQASSSR